MFLLFNYASVIPTDGDAFSLAAERLKTCDMVCCRDCGYDRRSRLHTLGFRGRFAPQTNEPASARLACAAVGLFRGFGRGLELRSISAIRTSLAREHPLHRRPSATLRRRSVPPKDQPVLTWILERRSRPQFKPDISSILPAPRGCGAVNCLTAT